MVNVSWPATTGLTAGTGQMHIWTLTDLDFAPPDGSGNIAATGTVRPCGSQIPELTKTAIAGGGKVLTVIPDTVWEQPTMPEFQVAGTLSGFGVGATISMDAVASTVGLTMTNPASDPWPASGTGVTTVDHDGDGRPGILSVPRTDPPYAAPPLSLLGALDPNGPRASEVYIVTRTVIQLAGTRDTCTTASGPATVYRVDSHVVGCKRKDGAICGQAEWQFVDDNQPRFTIQSATYTMAQLPDGASCADVRAALP